MAVRFIALRDTGVSTCFSLAIIIREAMLRFIDYFTPFILPRLLQGKMEDGGVWLTTGVERVIT